MSSLGPRPCDYVRNLVSVEELHGEHWPEILVGEVGPEVVLEISRAGLVGGGLVAVRLEPEPLRRNSFKMRRIILTFYYLMCMSSDVTVFFLVNVYT